MFKNCTKCQHAVTKPSKSQPLQEGMKRVKGDYYVKCMAGSTEKMVDFFKRNLSIPYGGMDEVFECYAKNEQDERAERLIRESKEILASISKTP